MLLLHSNFIPKSSLIDGFSMRFNWNSEVAYFLLGHPVYIIIYTLQDAIRAWLWTRLASRPIKHTCTWNQPLLRNLLTRLLMSHLKRCANWWSGALLKLTDSDRRTFAVKLFKTDDINLETEYRMCSNVSCQASLLMSLINHFLTKTTKLFIFFLNFVVF